MRILFLVAAALLHFAFVAHAAEGSKEAKGSKEPEVSVALLNILNKQNIGKPNPLITNIAGRDSTSLNGKWNVIVDEHQFGGGGFLTAPYFQPMPELKNGFQLREHSFDNRRQLNVPGDWNTQDDRLFRYRGVVWYQRNFDIQKDSEQRYFIHFDGVNYSSNVYLNGQPLATHHGGYTAFNVEVTEQIKSGDNFLVVRVDAFLDNSSVPTLQTSDFFKYGGITRDVNLITVPKTFIQNYHVYLDDLESNSSRAWVQLDGESSAKIPCTISIPEIDFEQTVNSDTEGKAHFSFSADLERWSPENPKLYDVVISAAGKSVTDQIGFRKFETVGKELFLNGEAIKLRGISLHDESPLKPGVAFDDADATAQLRLIKEMNGNFARLAHYPHNERIVRMADRLGLLVWSEIPVVSLLDWENEETLTIALTQIEDNISRDLNRASVVIWSIANETMPESKSRLEFLRALTDKARSLDGSNRPIAAALVGNVREEFFQVTRRLVAEMQLDESITDPETQQRLAAMGEQMGSASALDQEIVVLLDDALGEIVDIIGYNQYFGWYYSRPLANNLPVDEATVRRTMFKIMPDIRFRNSFNKPIIISEFGAGAKKSFKSPHGKEAIWTEGYQAKVYKAQLDMLSRNAWVQGWSPWILKDFRSALRQMNGIQDGYNRKGVVSEKGKKKKAYFVLKDFYKAMQ